MSVDRLLRRTQYCGCEGVLRMEYGSSKWKFECQPKPTPVGLKLLGLACPRTGYVVSFLLDKKGESTVEEKLMTLCLRMKGMWYHLYMDRYFVSVRLFKRLLQEGVYEDHGDRTWSTSSAPAGKEVHELVRTGAILMYWVTMGVWNKRMLFS